MAHTADVAVLGAGLAGLAAARDLVAGGADVVVLEARERPGGRVEQVELPDGRIVQLGGEIVGAFHTAYLTLVGELGLTVVPSGLTTPGLDTWALTEGVSRGEVPAGFDANDVADHARVEEAFGEIVASIDPDDPWAHEDAATLDALSVEGWLRGIGARPNVIRLREVYALGLAAGSLTTTSLLAYARKEAAAGYRGFYDYETWESLRVAEGSATVALRMAAELGGRIRYREIVTGVDVGGRHCEVALASGEAVHADAVVCALPVGPLADVELAGVDEERVRSLRAQRSAPAAKLVAVFDRDVWADVGASGVAHGDGLVASVWPQGPRGVLSSLVPPERLAHLTAASPPRSELAFRECLTELFGAAAGRWEHAWSREWGIDPFTRGYVTAWWPGDVTAVGPRHGTHAPPFYVCGSDQWVAGYMEGAVRTGRSAAAAALAAGSHSGVER